MGGGDLFPFMFSITENNLTVPNNIRHTVVTYV